MKFPNVFKILFLFSLFSAGEITAIPSITNVIPNSATIGKYDLFELKVILNAAFKNAYDYRQINLQALFTSPTGQNYTVDGFRFQDCRDSSNIVVIQGPAGWRIRFAPKETGAWTYTVTCRDSTGQSSYPSQSFTVTTSPNNGFL